MIEIEQLTKQYRSNSKPLTVLRNVTLRVNPGEFIVIRGPSGSGKTTLLLMIGGMLQPTEGSVRIDTTDLYSLSVTERARFRAEHIGFVFQMFHLIPYLTSVENVMAASSNPNASNAKVRAIELLEHVGLRDRIHHRPSQLSAGEKQRTAIARALINQPKLILADEPTGNLDRDNAREVLALLSDYHRQGGTVLLVTHGIEADSAADGVLTVRDGVIESGA